MDLYKLQQHRLWTVEEIDFSGDFVSWQTLNPEEQEFISVTLAWFANADNAVCENLLSRFLQEITIPEARGFFSIQSYIEFVHVQTYNMCIQAVIPDLEKQNNLMAAVKTNKIVQPKFETVFRWINSNASLATRLVAFAFVEGVFFASSFASIYWLRKQHKLPGICMANEFIIEDECLHVRFAALLYKHYIEQKLDTNSVHRMASDFVQLEHEFSAAACPSGLRGINKELMRQYVCRVADTVLELLGYEPLYHVANPFDWMMNVGLMGKSNFFEKRVAEYPNSVDPSEPGILLNLGSNSDLTTILFDEPLTDYPHKHKRSVDYEEFETTNTDFATARFLQEAERTTTWSAQENDFEKADPTLKTKKTSKTVKVKKTNKDPKKNKARNTSK